MRISDWSSDVCSSDLCRLFRGPQLVVGTRKSLHVRRITERAGVDDHVFQARAGGQVAQDISGIGYTATAARIDSKVKIVAAHAKLFGSTEKNGRAHV